MNKFIPLISLSLCIVLCACSNDQWEGFVYPNKNNLRVHRNIGVYESLESCRAAAWDMLSRISSIENGDYECGLNCEYRSDMGDIKVCEKTER